MIATIAVSAAAVIGILTIAYVFRDAMHQGYRITESFAIAKPNPPRKRAAVLEPAEVKGIANRHPASAA